jgi:hypothetical protein
MIKRAQTIAGIILCLAAAGGTVMADDIRKVLTIEFRGLGLLSKYDVIRGARFRAAGDGIIVDVESLERVLSRNSFLASYGVQETGGRLIISVEEKKPALILAVERGSKTDLYELDAAGAVISKNDAHTGRVPVLVLGSGDFPDGAASARTRSLIGLMALVRRTNPALYRELAEVSAGAGALRVTLRGRKTEYILDPEAGDFTRLAYVAGYCDRRERYPDEINLTGNAVIVR